MSAIRANTIIHGDCLRILKTLSDNSIDAIITDPPYGISYHGTRRKDKARWFNRIANDTAPYIWWLHDAARVLKPKGALSCFTRYDTEEAFRFAIRLAGLEPKTQVIWDKGVHGVGDCCGDFGLRHENIIFAVKGRFLFPHKRPVSVLGVQRLASKRLTHPNEKPVELLKHLIEATTRPGDIVLDPFVGSGTTAVAAKALGRRYIGIELDLGYANAAKARVSLTALSVHER
ncbi:MAG: site-specific DNA-methyltransferase [Rhizomicrobium sp.]|jgi:DNA modification methylase